MFQWIPGRRLGTKCVYFHFCETAIATALFVLARRLFHMTWWMLLVTLVAEYVSLRMCVITCLYSYSASTRLHTPACFRLPFLREVLVVVQEGIFGTMLLYSILHPLADFLTRSFESPSNRKSSAVRNPVLFVHGYACNAGFWYPILRYLSNADVGHLYTISLEPLHLDIPSYARQIALRVESILKKSESEKLILVGHSMGGLAARAYVKWLGGEKHVAKLITIQTPHKGTQLTRLLRCISDPTVLDMVPGATDYLRSFASNVRGVCEGSDFLTELDASSEKERDVPMTSLYSYHDTLICPQESPKLSVPNARNIPFAGIGHLVMPFYPCIQRTILHELIDCT